MRALRELSRQSSTLKRAFVRNRKDCYNLTLFLGVQELTVFLVLNVQYVDFYMMGMYRSHDGKPKAFHGRVCHVCLAMGQLDLINENSVNYSTD